jgi:hypothetical protein
MSWFVLVLRNLLFYSLVGDVLLRETHGRRDKAKVYRHRVLVDPHLRQWHVC